MNNSMEFRNKSDVSFKKIDDGIFTTIKIRNSSAGSYFTSDFVVSLLNSQKKVCVFNERMGLITSNFGLEQEMSESQ